MFFYAVMLSWWDFFWQSFCNLVMHVSSMDFANDNIVSQLHKISMCMFSQPTSHRLDTSEFTMWCRTIHLIQCEPEKLKIGCPLFQPSCISMGDRMFWLDRFTVTDISRAQRGQATCPRAHTADYTSLLCPLPCTCWSKWLLLCIQWWHRLRWC